MILVDTNVLIDVMEGRSEDSRKAFALAIRDSGAGINQVILAELLGGQRSPIEAAKRLPSALRQLNLPWAAAPLAARAFARYRREFDGPKISPLPDFFIGAHAEAAGLTLLTRDKGRYETYFPSVSVIFP